MILLILYSLWEVIFIPLSYEKNFDGLNDITYMNALEIIKSYSLLLDKSYIWFLHVLHCTLKYNDKMKQNNEKTEWEMTICLLHTETLCHEGHD
jgi:hypothetical protein